MSDSGDIPTRSTPDLPEFEGQVLFKGNFDENPEERRSSLVLDWIKRWRSGP